MAKRKPHRVRLVRVRSFTGIGSRRRRVLILPKYLAEEAENKLEQGKRQEHAFEVTNKMGRPELKGHLNKKEPHLDAES